MAAALLGSCCYAHAQPVPVAAPGQCPQPEQLEAERYTIRTVRIESPFGFLPWVSARMEGAQRGLSDLIGKPYRRQELIARRDDLTNLNFPPESEGQRIRFAVTQTGLENCVDRKVDVIYSIYSPQIAAALGGTIESVKAEKSAPEKAAGADTVYRRFRISPSGGYDASQKFSGGARMEYHLPDDESNRTPINSIVVEGVASTSMHDLSATVGGSITSPQMAHAEWQLNYLNSLQPSDQLQLRKERLAAQLSAMTRPLGQWQIPLRFGGALELGRLESNAPSTGVSPSTVPSSDYGSAKLYVGTTGRLKRNVFSASYGLELGSSGHDGGVDWMKHIGDLAYDVAIPVGDHRLLDIESRLTGGHISERGAVPVGARFFGGNRQEDFIAGDSWRIRANPVIRSIAANRYTTPGIGATRFVAYNLTAAVPIWRRPLVPVDVYKNPEVMAALDFQLATATNSWQAHIEASDRHFLNARDKVKDVIPALAKLKTAVVAAQKKFPSQFAELFKACTSAIARAEQRAEGALESTDLGGVAALLSSDEDRLNKVSLACTKGLNSEIRDPAISADGEALSRIHAVMESEFSKIDRAASSRQARTEMASVKQTLDSLFYDLNILSISPVFIFDAAHIDAASPGMATRYGVGGGLRINLVNSVDLTLAYVANPRRVAGESAGAFTLTFRVKDFY